MPLTPKKSLFLPNKKAAPAETGNTGRFETLI